MVGCGKITVETACGICADFVPESEDERIRKELKHYLEVRRCQTNDDEEYIGCNHFLAWLEKQGEQKYVDKIEPKHVPKFHEGDWVVYNNDICQIVKREEGCNKLVTVFGIEKELVNERNLSTARLWTINDAKDGDVLAEDSCIFIIKKLNHDHSAKIYCCLFDDGDFEVSSSLAFDDTSTYPATKKQRDLLFQKMREAGYEWSEVTHKLKKIGEEVEIPFGAKNSELVEMSYNIPSGFHAEIEGDKIIIRKGEKQSIEEVNGEDYGIDGLWHAQRILEKTLGSVDGYQTDDGLLDHKAAITAVKKQYEKKPTLEDTAKAFLQALSDTPYNNTPIVEAQIITKQLLTFLSDPKAYNPNAINEHKSAEWSEEDEQLIDEVAVCLRKYEEKVQGGYSKFYVQSLADRIESLRPGNTCKATGWSEEDSYMLEQAIKCVNNSGKLDVSTEEIEDWLKSLKQRHAVEAE